MLFVNLKCGILTLILLFCSYYNLYSLSVSPSIGLSFENGNGNAIRYSRHENLLDKDLSILISIGYKFRMERFLIFTSLGCKYSNTKHSAWSGYIQEAIEDDALAGEEEKQRVTGNGVSYEQQVIIPFVDLVTKAKFVWIF